jgi:hypothetical protein
MTTFLLAALYFGVLAPATPTSSPEVPRRADSVVGEVTTVTAGERSLVVKPDGGEAQEVRADEKTSILRARPGAATLAGATPARLDEITVGDRVMARGHLVGDGSFLIARQIVLMTQGDIAQRHDAERAEWRRRGILGTVSAVDSAKGEITLQARSFGGTQPVAIETAGRTVAFRRYAPDSVKFADARPSALADVQIGDQLRALGDRGADGNTFAAEQVVFGTFRTVTGRVSEVDAARSELTVTDESSRQPVRVSVGADARLRRLPPDSGGRPSEDPLGNLPAITLDGVKPGDRVLVSSTKGSDPSYLTAIALVTGLPAPGPSRAAGARGARGSRGMDADLPAELMDLGMSIP